MNSSKTFNIIVPIKDAEKRIVDWKIVGRIMAGSAESAIHYAKQRYGIEADVRPWTSE
jgi:hypothetical protein